jgi:3-hydroxyacyl-CoA dehydrogenase/enoyl-CoA hydratase/3-hydroxybutyryl-CoA epimerase
VLGLPEVKLGLLPGAGGTQRLREQVGLMAALSIITTGRNVRAREARRLGLVDEVVAAPIVVQVAVQQAVRALDGRSRAAKLTWQERLQRRLSVLPGLRQGVFAQARRVARKQSGGHYPAVDAIIDVLEEGSARGREAGFRAEAEAFGRLAMTAQAKALMSIYFATQALKKQRGLPGSDAEARPIASVGVLGAGFMGAGIAAVTIQKAALPVRMKDLDAARLAAAKKYVHKLLERDVRRKRLRRVEAKQIAERLSGDTQGRGLERVPVLIEAVFEDLVLKQRLLAEWEANSAPEAIFASNTSALPIGLIAARAQRPEHVIGMHYFSPVEKMPLLEIVVTEHTADWVVATCVALGKSQGKTVIVVRDGPGFYTSRILASYVNEAAWLLAEGARVEQVDAALCGWGFPVGPLKLLDEVGLDVAAKVADSMYQAFGERMQVPDAVQHLLGDGRLGRKSGRGIYVYGQGKKAKPVVDAGLYQVLGTAGKAVAVDATEMQERLVLQMVNEAARCLQEGILFSAQDGDVGAIFGLGFPPYTGGPFQYVDTQGAARIVAQLERYAERYGERFKPAQILLDHARTGQPFRA